MVLQAGQIIELISDKEVRGTWDGQNTGIPFKLGQDEARNKWFRIVPVQGLATTLEVPKIYQRKHFRILKDMNFWMWHGALLPEQQQPLPPPEAANQDRINVRNLDLHQFN